MIDKVRLYKDFKDNPLDISKFDEKFRYENYYVMPKVDYGTGEVLRAGYQVNRYIYEYNSLKIIYSLETNKLKVEGRLPNASRTRNLVYNLDDYFLGQEKIIKYDVIQEEKDSNWLCENSFYDADDRLVTPDQWEEIEIIEKVEDDIATIIKSINNIICELTKEKVDILDFKISYIEITFNIFQVNHVDKYIELFNIIFDKKKDARYKNFVREKNLESDTSFYVKSKSNYNKNINDSYTVNFYNKLDQLKSLENNPRNHAHVTAEDKRLAEDVLRLEVQLAYQGLKTTTKVFKQFLDIFFCMSIIIEKYKHFISKNEDLDFYSYKKAKAIIVNTDKLEPKVKARLLCYIQDKYQRNKSFSYQTDNKYKKILGFLGVHWCFIPTRFGIDYLVSPMKLLKDKVDDISRKFNYWEEYEDWRGYPIEMEHTKIINTGETPFD